MNDPDDIALQIAQAQAQRDENLLSVREVAQLLNVTPRWVYRAIEREELAHVRVGKFIRFRRSEIEAFLARQTRQAT